MSPALGTLAAAFNGRTIRRVEFTDDHLDVFCTDGAEFTVTPELADTKSPYLNYLFFWTDPHKRGEMQS